MGIELMDSFKVVLIRNMFVVAITPVRATSTVTNLGILELSKQLRIILT